jgi:outer membrane cobalamin receptor
VVTDSRLSSGIVTGMKEVHILIKDEIINLQSFSIRDILYYMGGVDLQRRSINGVQSDFSIRGSLFE